LKCLPLFSFQEFRQAKRSASKKSVKNSACLKIKRHIPGNLEQLNGEFTDFFWTTGPPRSEFPLFFAFCFLFSLLI
jgi:hypothetical protein